MKRYKYLIIMLFGLVLVSAAWWFTPRTVKALSSEYKIPSGTNTISINPGEYGDLFGAANALFSGFAFVGLLVTVLMQNAELREQGDQTEKRDNQIRDELQLLRASVDVQTNSVNAQEQSGQALITWAKIQSSHLQSLDRLERMTGAAVYLSYNYERYFKIGWANGITTALLVQKLSDVKGWQPDWGDDENCIKALNDMIRWSKDRDFFMDKIRRLGDDV